MTKISIISVFLFLVFTNNSYTQIIPHTFVQSDMSSGEKLIAPVQKALNDARETLNNPRKNNNDRANTIAIANTKPNVYALIVGISDYKYINDLNFCDDDANKIYEFLKSPQGGAVPDNQISILIDNQATKASILTSMETLFSEATERDLVIFFFSGHGSEQGTFCPYDQNRGTTLSYDEISSTLLNCKAKHKLCIADACYSGGLNPEMFKFGLKSSTDIYYEALKSSIGGTALMLSSRNTEKSQERPELEQGAFSYYYIEGLKGYADENKNGIVSISELYEYVRKNVKSKTNGKQNPVLNGKYDSNMPIGVVEK
jgi:hypothetical protein